MTLFEGLKAFPKVDLHIDFLGSIPLETIQKMTQNTPLLDVQDIVEFDSLTDYDNSRNLVRSLLNSYSNIEFAFKELIEKFKEENMIYGEIFVNLDSFLPNLDKKEILITLFKVIKDSELKLNIVLEIESSISKEELYDNLNLLYEYYHKGINGISFKKNKLDNFETYKALFDKFVKDDISYIVTMDSKITSQNKEIMYGASRIIYNLFIEPDEVFLKKIKDEKILLEFPITYQSYFHLYDNLENHFVFNLFKENVLLTFTTIDRTSLNTDLLNEYCKLFNVFPFKLHDLVVLTLNCLSIVNLRDEEKNNLIEEFKSKANQLL